MKRKLLKLSAILILIAGFINRVSAVDFDIDGFMKNIEDILNNAKTLPTELTKLKDQAIKFSAYPTCARLKKALVTKKGPDGKPLPEAALIDAQKKWNDGFDATTGKKDASGNPIYLLDSAKNKVNVKCTDLSIPLGVAYQVVGLLKNQIIGDKLKPGILFSIMSIVNMIVKTTGSADVEKKINDIQNVLGDITKVLGYVDGLFGYLAKNIKVENPTAVAATK